MIEHPLLIAHCSMRNKHQGRVRQCFVEYSHPSPTDGEGKFRLQLRVVQIFVLGRVFRTSANPKSQAGLTIQPLHSEHCEYDVVSTRGKSDTKSVPAEYAVRYPRRILQPQA